MVDLDKVGIGNGHDQNIKYIIWNFHIINKTLKEGIDWKQTLIIPR